MTSNSTFDDLVALRERIRTENVLDEYHDVKKKYIAVRADNALEYFSIREINLSPGWLNVVIDFLNEARKLSPSPGFIQITQIKKKFAGLRIYYQLKENNIDLHDKLDALVRKAESKADKICEVCGNPGKILEERIMIACERHKNV
jgi:hypothetical protein